MPQVLILRLCTEVGRVEVRWVLIYAVPREMHAHRRSGPNCLLGCGCCDGEWSVHLLGENCPAAVEQSAHVGYAGHSLAFNIRISNDWYSSHKK